MSGFEPEASSLPRKRSTPELHRQKKSGRPGSNRRHSAWKADALPTELLPHFNRYEYLQINLIFQICIVGRAGFEPAKVKPTDLQSVLVGRLSISPNLVIYKSRWRDSNPRPADYKSAALAS